MKIFILILPIVVVAICNGHLNNGSHEMDTPRHFKYFLNITKIYYRDIKLLTTVIFISCYNVNENLVLTKYFNDNNMQITVINNEVKLAQFDYEYFVSLETRVGIIGDLECDLVSTMFNQIRTNRALERIMFKNNIIWILHSFDSDMNSDSFYTDWFESVNLLPSSDLVVLAIVDDTIFGIYDIYKISPGADVMVTAIGTNFTGTDTDDECEYVQHVFAEFGTIANRRSNFQGIYLDCAIVIAFPQLFTRLDDLRLRHIDTLARSNYPIMEALAHDLNFSLNLRQTDNFGWYRNGTFDGLMHLFETEEIEFGALGVFMREERIAIIDWSAETHTIRACIMFRQPPLSAVSNIFILPFNIDVWIGSFSLFLVVFVFILFQWLMPSTRVLLHPLESVTFVMGAICQQGFHQSLSTISGRLLVFLTFVSSLFLFTSYSANIVALLQSPSNAIKSIPDLINSPLKMIVQNTVYNHIYYNETNSTVIRDLFNKKIRANANSSFVLVDKGVEQIRTGTYAYQVEAHAAYQVISDTFGEHEKCGLKELEAFKLPHVTVPLKKHSGYKEIFTQRLRWQREVGLIKREYKRWFPQKPQCENNVGGFVSVGLTECRAPLYILCAGILLATLVCVIEMIVHRFTQKRYAIKFSCRRRKRPLKKMNV